MALASSVKLALVCLLAEWSLLVYTLGDRRSIMAEWPLFQTSLGWFFVFCCLNGLVRGSTCRSNADYGPKAELCHIFVLGGRLSCNFVQCPFSRNAVEYETVEDPPVQSFDCNLLFEHTRHSNVTNRAPWTKISQHTRSASCFGTVAFDVLCLSHSWQSYSFCRIFPEKNSPLLEKQGHLFFTA